MLDLKNIFTIINTDEEAALLLSCIGINWSDWPLIMKLGGPQEFLRCALVAAKLKQKISKEPLLLRLLSSLREGLDRFYEEKGFLLSPGTSNIFSQLKNAPVLFFGRFNRALLEEKPSVAIVGSRTADSEAVKLARALGAVLAKRGITIISGGATGIDFAAHEGAIGALGSTVIVSGVACSFEVSDIGGRLRALGLLNQCVLFPYGPTTPQGKFMFVERNKYVAALADAVVVVQGNQSSGTLHTARFAKELNVPLFALPGAINNPLSFVPNLLLSEGSARAVVDFDQFADSLVTKSAKPLKSQAKVEKSGSVFASAELLPPLLKLIKDKGKQASMDELIVWSGRSYLSIQQDMLRFEMDGLIFKRGSQFVLADN